MTPDDTPGLTTVSRGSASGTFVELRHGPTHLEVDGPVSGEPVIFMPGATLPVSLWDGLFERLASAGYRTVRYDRYGLGFSERPRVQYDLELFDEQLVELLRALEITRRVNLIGLAFGCPIAAEFALRHPGAVERICMIAPDGFAPRMKLGARVGLLPYVGAMFSPLFGNRMLRARAPWYSTDERIAAEVLARLDRQLQYRGFKRALRSSLRNLPFDHGADLYRRVVAADVPVQLIWGRTDMVTPMPDEAVLLDLFSHADVHLLDGVGHLPHFERLDQTAALITGFLGEGSP